MQDFKNKVVLITGASSGIGESLALAFAREGARPILVARDESRLRQVQEECRKLGAEALILKADITDERQVQAVAEAVHARYPAVDVLINNAGVVMAGLTWEVETADWRRLLDLNVMGVVHSIRAFVPRMIGQRSGHVVNMASVSGIAGMRGMSTYSATKFAVVGITESLRAELYHHGIGVSVVCPGYVKTPIAGKVKVVGSLDNAAMHAGIQREFARSRLTGDIVAERTLRGIRRNQALIGIGREAVLARFARRWAPVLLERFQRGPRKRSAQRA
jgi:short-subunit dehydrogenase